MFLTHQIVLTALCVLPSKDDFTQTAVNGYSTAFGRLA
jgi:hypothetical protein